MRSAKFMVTTPIFYPNGAPHIGHLYTMLYSDSFRLWLNLRHPLNTTIYTTGVDEHGLKIYESSLPDTP